MTQVKDGASLRCSPTPSYFLTLSLCLWLFRLGRKCHWYEHWGSFAYPLQSWLRVRSRRFPCLGHHA